jgi:hypothetical protein
MGQLYSPIRCDTGRPFDDWAPLIEEAKGVWYRYQTTGFEEPERSAWEADPVSLKMMLCIAELAMDMEEHGPRSRTAGASQRRRIILTGKGGPFADVLPINRGKRDGLR